jgi:hypothetical protein
MLLFLKTRNSSSGATTTLHCKMASTKADPVETLAVTTIIQRVQKRQHTAIRCINMRWQEPNHTNGRSSSSKQVPQLPRGFWQNEVKIVFKSRQMTYRLENLRELRCNGTYKRLAAPITVSASNGQASSSGCHSSSSTISSNASGGYSGLHIFDDGSFGGDGGCQT